jgi:DNA-binding LacI/PurR family transcriptional regulator
MKTKYEELAENLKQRILTLEPGMKLPSVREIVRENGVSQFTVVRAMNLLEEAGYVKRRSTVGVYGARPEHQTALKDIATRRILILTADIFIVEFIDTVQQVLTQRGYLPRIRHYNLQEPAEKWLPRVRFEGLIFDGSCPPEVVELLRKNKIPFVCQGLRYAHQEVDNTCGDERLAGALAAIHLAELGHKKIAVLQNEPHVPDGFERVRGFLNQAKIMGVQAELLDCQTPHGTCSATAAKNFVGRMLQNNKLEFTGLFTISGKGGMGALNALYEHGIRVPDQISVVSCDHLPEAEFLCPALTTIGYSHQDRAKGLIDILEQRFAGDISPAIQKIYEPKLIKRNSTGPALNET